MDQLPVPLSERELAVARLCAEGLTMQEIAAVEGISTSVVSRHISLAKAKLGVAKKRQIYGELKRRGLLR